MNWAIPLKSELQQEEYGLETASIMGKIMCHLQHQIKNQFGFSNKHYSLRKGISTFGLKAKNAAKKEMTQLHEKTVFTPLKI